MNTEGSISGLWAVLNSPLLLLIMGFVLTTLFGQIITSMLKKSALEREMKLKALAREEEVRLVRLHEDRADAIKLLHNKLIDVERSLFNLLYNWRPVGLVPEFVKPEEVVLEVREYRKEAEKSKIYFDAKLISVIDNVCEKLESTMGTLEDSIMRSGYMPGGDSWQGVSPEFADEAWQGVHIHLDTAKQQFRSHIRELLGV